MQPAMDGEEQAVFGVSHLKDESSAVLALGAPEDTVTFLKRLTYQPECFIASRRTLTYGSTKTVRSMQLENAAPNNHPNSRHHTTAHQHSLKTGFYETCELTASQAERNKILTQRPKWHLQTRLASFKHWITAHMGRPGESWATVRKTKPA